jgi:hypothetical protein
MVRTFLGKKLRAWGLQKGVLDHNTCPFHEVEAIDLANAIPLIFSKLYTKMSNMRALKIKEEKKASNGLYFKSSDTCVHSFKFITSFRF